MLWSANEGDAAPTRFLRNLMLATATLVLVATICRVSPAEDRTTKLHGKPAAPNIVLVFIDDMGWGDFSCFGNSEVETENIDRLAGEGVRFEQFYVASPICSPSRTAISTGQYPQRWRISSYLARRELNEQRGMAQWLDPKAPMLARSLKKAGYATGPLWQVAHGWPARRGRGAPDHRVRLRRLVDQLRGPGPRGFCPCVTRTTANRHASMPSARICWDEGPFSGKTARRSPPVSPQRPWTSSRRPRRRASRFT